MPDLFPCERVGPDFIDTAPYRTQASIELSTSPHHLWEVLTDVEAWPCWFPLITSATWTSSAPRRTGSTRILAVRGGLAATEEVLVWDPPYRLATRINESSRRTTGASAEEYRIEPTEHGCRLTWTIARRGDMSRVAWVLLKPLRSRAFRRALRKLRRYTENRYVTSV